MKAVSAWWFEFVAWTLPYDVAIAGGGTLLCLVLLVWFIYLAQIPQGIADIYHAIRVHRARRRIRLIDPGEREQSMKRVMTERRTW